LLLDAQASLAPWKCHALFQQRVALWLCYWRGARWWTGGPRTVALKGEKPWIVMVMQGDFEGDLLGVNNPA